jgi:LPS sulfotransferase NodH
MKKFIVLTRSRTGSNLLISLLNSHPAIEAKGELLARCKKRSFERLIEMGLSSDDEHTKAAGFKIFYYHPIDADGTQIWKTLTDMTDLHVIHLKRRNILRTQVSRKLAELNNVWQQTATDISTKSGAKLVSFGVEELESDFKRTEGWEIKGALDFKSHSILDVFYEDLVKDTSNICGGIYDFLEVSTWNPSSSLVRQNPEKLSDLISNFDELKEAFSETDWAGFFD